MEEKRKKLIIQELSDEQFENVSGGVAPGDRVSINLRCIQYCSHCGRLLSGVRATVLSHVKNDIWFVRLDCCGAESSAVEYVLEPVD